MNPEHAVDIYADLSETRVVVLRRRDMRWWQSSGQFDDKSVGKVVVSALDSKRRSADLIWSSDVDLDFVHSADVHCAVVWREGHKTIVTTPIWVWGKAPNIELDEKPTHLALGQAVLTQIRHSVMEKGKHESV